MIEKAFRTGGFIFPETVDEVKEFERIYGRTDVILPAELQNLDFLYSQFKKSSKKKITIIHSENLAMAAREGNDQLPDEIKNLMAEHRKKADSKRKK
jgi:hypothetical protein